MSSFKSLNLPIAELKIREGENGLDVFDIVRKKYVKLEPEEWVRQHLIHYFIFQLNYPKSLFQVEVPVKVNALNQRADIVISDTKGKPHILVECKSYAVELESNVLYQAIRYNKIIQAKFVVVSNGIEHHCLKWNAQTGMLQAIEAFPEFVNNE